MIKKKPYHNTDSKHFYDWVERAAEDIISAKILMSDDRCYKSSAFHCQQAIEKALKAFILLNTDELVEGHSLSWLCKRAIKINDKFNDWLDESIILNKCYIETRYPTDLPLYIDEYEIKSAYKMAYNMFEFICKEVDDDIDEIYNELKIKF